MTATRKRLTPNSLTGWDPKHVVEIELVDRHSATTQSVYAVYLNGVLIGHASGYAKYYANRRPAWGLSEGTERPGSSVAVAYVYESRRQSVEMLVERALRDATR